MNCKELRVGNYVYCKGIIDEVLGIGDNDYYTEKHYHGVRDEDLTPIPLTDKILLKCGFKIGKENNYILHDLIEIVETDYGNTFFLMSNFIKSDVKYLHQLQNLYFALTNKELNYEL